MPAPVALAGRNAEVCQLSQLVLLGRFPDRRTGRKHAVARTQRVGNVSPAGQPSLCQPDHPWGRRRREIGDDLKASQYVIGSYGWGYLPHD
jgi:hypothetical protein